MTKHNSPRELIQNCLEPLGLNERSPAAQEAVRRLLDAFKSFQPDGEPSKGPSQEFSRTPAIVINEAAHGYDS